MTLLQRESIVPLDNATRQAAWRARRDAELKSLRQTRERLKGTEVEKNNLSAEVSKLRAQVATLDAELLANTLGAGDEEFSETLQGVIDRTVQRELEVFKARYVESMQAEISAQVDARVSHYKSLVSLAKLMSLKEFKLVRGRLHPDRLPPNSSAEDREKQKRAFQIFNRMELNARLSNADKWTTRAR